jgi:hypothetical protein
LFAGILPGNFIANLNTENLTAGLSADKLNAGSRVAGSLHRVDGNGLLNRFSGYSGSELPTELAAPRTASMVFGAVGGATSDLVQEPDSELLDRLGASAAEVLGRASIRVVSTLEGLFLRSARRYIALALLAELEVIMYISDRQLFGLINDHFGFLANVFAVCLFL